MGRIFWHLQEIWTARTGGLGLFPRDPWSQGWTMVGTAGKSCLECLSDRCDGLLRPDGKEASADGIKVLHGFHLTLPDGQ